MTEQTERMQATLGEQSVLMPSRRVTIAGREYEIHPLGLDAQAPLSRMLVIGAERGEIKDRDLILTDEQGNPVLDAFGSPQPDQNATGRLMMCALGWAQPEVFVLLGMLLGVTHAELRDPRRFPLACMGLLLAELNASLDYRAFLSGQPQPSSDAGADSPSRSDESST